jgi:O-methyltransferase involved in polyketide biosynthesis
MVGEKAHLSKEKETMLITVYGKALESRSPHSLLRDRFAEEAVRSIDYDFSRLKVDANLAACLAIRAKTLDDWTSAFLAKHPNAIVLHLGCGLDTRIFRIDPPPGVDWFDVDYPEVIELRRKLYPSRDHYQLIASSVTEPGWLNEVPRDRPAMVVAEGLTPYLGVEEGLQLFSRLLAHLPSGELVFDAYSGLGLKILRLNPSFRATGAEVHWSIEDPRELEQKIPKLHLVEDLCGYRPEHAAHMSWFAGLFIRLWSYIPALRKIGRLLRFRF